MIYKISIEQLKKEVTIDLPASKSLSNRALIMQALCKEPCHLTHLSDCDDTVVMQQAFAQLATNDDTPLTIDIGAAGTSMRFLTAFFASREGAEVIMTGSERMKQRPIKILVDALRTLGAEIKYLETEGCPPLRIHGKKLEGGPLSIDGSTSSQYISALLMIAPTLEKGLTLTLTGNVTSRPYIQMTLGMMQEFRVDSRWDETKNIIEVRPQEYKARSYEVESDWSAASYWYEIMATNVFDCFEKIHLSGLHKQSLQGDSRVAEFFKPLAVVTKYNEQGVTLTRDEENTPYPKQIRFDLSEQPDLAQTIVVTLCSLNISFHIKGLHTLRIKETDRIAALENELKKWGYEVRDCNDDEMYNLPASQSESTDDSPIQTYKDHRMAMAFASNVDAYPVIEDPEVVTKSYPQFWDHLRQAGFKIEEVTKEQL